jgi:hypothetical protein
MRVFIAADATPATRTNSLVLIETVIGYPIHFTAHQTSHAAGRTTIHDHAAAYHHAHSITVINPTPANTNTEQTAHHSNAEKQSGTNKDQPGSS